MKKEEKAIRIAVEALLNYGFDIAFINEFFEDKINFQFINIEDIREEEITLRKFFKEKIYDFYVKKRNFENSFYEFKLKCTNYPENIERIRKQSRLYSEFTKIEKNEKYAPTLDKFIQDYNYEIDWGVKIDEFVIEGKK